MNAKKLTLTATITAAALVTFIIEIQLPPLTPIYGIKLGLANIFTLFAMYALGVKEAFLVLAVRVALGNIIAGQMMSFAYSACGGLLSFAAMLILIRITDIDTLWAASAVSAVFHNIGQIAAAVFFTKTLQIVCYLPVLVISGIVTGVFTGLCAMLVLKKLSQAGLIRLRIYKKFKLHKTEDAI